VKVRKPELPVANWPHGDDDETARLRDRAEFLKSIGWAKSAAKHRDLAEGVASGILSGERVAWRPRDGPPSEAWIAAHRKSTRFLAERAAERGEDPAPCWACGGRYCGEGEDRWAAP
jgi:hypothetical protein